MRSIDRRNALKTYLLGTIGQIVIVCIVVFLLRSNGIKVDYSTFLGMIAIGLGGSSSAFWGIIVAVKYKKNTVKNILFDFVKMKQAYSSYIFALIFLLLDFCSVFIGGTFQVHAWYIPIVLFLKAIIFGGIEEIGWRYTFQPILEETCNYVLATIVTFFAWGIWHFLYFYIEGTLAQVHGVSFLMGLLTNCFILSALYVKTRSLWICVMTHALINVFSQISQGGNFMIMCICRVIIIVGAIIISYTSMKKRLEEEKMARSRISR